MKDATLNPKPAPSVRWAWSCFYYLSASATSIYGFNLIENFNQISFFQSLWLGIPALLLVLSYRQLNFDEIASIKFAGYPVSNTGPGPKLLPWPLQLTRHKRNVQQRQFPADNDNIFKGGDKEPLQTMPDGSMMVRPMRITTGKPSHDDASEGREDPLSIQMAVEITFYLRMQIINPLLFEMQYGDEDGFWQQVRDSGERILTNRIANLPGVSGLITSLSSLMNDLNDTLEKLCRKGGVEIIESGMTSPDITHALAEALRNIGVLRAEGEGQASKIRQEGAAAADVERYLIEAMEKTLANADSATVAAYLGKTALSDKTVVLGTGGIEQLFGLAKIINESKKESS